MSFTLYTSADVGAPVLSGTVGALQALLHACLVTGYGAKAAAGWSRPWLDASGNIAVFKPADAIDAFYHVNDNAPGAGLGKEARIHMGVTHNGAGVLATLAPQNMGFPLGWFIRKSNATTTAARAWYLYADAKTAYLAIETLDTAGTFCAYAIGKALPLSPLEAFPFILGGRYSENTTSVSYSEHSVAYWTTTATITRGFCCPVHADGSAAASGLQSAPNTFIRGLDTGGAWGATGPGAPGARTGIMPMWDGLLVDEQEPRFRLRGLWSAYCAGALTEGDTWSATIGGVLRSFVVRRVSTAGIAVFETSDTLDL